MLAQGVEAFVTALGYHLCNGRQEGWLITPILGFDGKRAWEQPWGVGLQHESTGRYVFHQGA